MKTHLTFAFVALLVTSVVMTLPVQAQDTEAAIRKVTEQINQAWNKHDAKTLATFFDKDWRNFDLVGNAALESTLSELFKNQKDNKRKLLDEVAILSLTPDVAIYMGVRESTGQLDDNGKPSPPSKQRFARVYRLKEGKWLAVATYSIPLEEQ